jgi:hypothetical protein
MLAMSGTAGAATQIPTAIVPQTPFTAGLPFDSGQQVDITVPGGYLTPGAAVNIFECADPNGTVANLPTTITECDGLTNYSGGSITTESDGSISTLTGSDTSSGQLYTIYALPDKYSLSETSSHGAVCGNSAATTCVLYIGNGGGQDTGLSAPHVFSQPFKVVADATDSGIVNPGDGTPEFPLAVGLPLAAVGIFGVTVAVRRRRAAAKVA